MRQWEIYDFPHPSTDNPHPCVVISPDSLAGNPAFQGVNVLPCQTLRGARILSPVEIGLDEADGLDRPTVVKCHFTLYFAKGEAGRRRGVVQYERRLAIKRALRTVYGL